MQVSAGAAAARGGGDRAFLADLGRRQGHGDDLVAGALVVDHRAGAELGDPDEPWPLDVVALAAAGQAGDVGGQRQPGERVAGQEALGGEVPVGVEVGLEVVGVLVAEQVQLDAGVGGAPGRLLAVRVPDRRVHRPCGLRLELLPARPGTGPATGCTRRRTPAPPCWRRRRSRSRATRVRVAARAASRRAGWRARAAARTAAALSVSRLRTSASSCRLGFSPATSRIWVSEPCRSWPVSASQIACTCDLMRSSLARSSRGGATLPPTICVGPPEVVLVVGVAGRAVGDDQRGLPGTAGSPGALRVVRRGGRHVPQADGAEGVDVDAEFHRRRAVQHRQRRLAELGLPLLPVKRRHLRGVLLGPQPGQGGGHALVEVPEERVDPRAFLVVEGAAHPVFRAGQAGARMPVDDRGPQPVAGRVVTVGLDRLDEQSRPR